MPTKALDQLPLPCPKCFWVVLPPDRGANKAVVVRDTQETLKTYLCRSCGTTFALPKDAKL